MNPADMLKRWVELPIVVMDVETCGLDPEKHGVVEFAAVRFEMGMPVKRFGTLVDPCMPIPAEASEIHGIKDEDVDGKPTLAQAIIEAAPLLVGAYPAAYNASFDRSFILPALDDGPSVFPKALTFDPDWPWLDPLVMVRKFDSRVPGKGRHKLAASCERHGIPLNEAHRAQDDAEAAGRLMFKLVDENQAVGNLTISEMLRRQKMRAAEQEADFQKWLARQPKRDEDAT